MPTYVFKCPEGHVVQEKMSVKEYTGTKGFIPCLHGDHNEWGRDWTDWAEVQIQPVAHIFAINDREFGLTKSKSYLGVNRSEI